MEREDPVTASFAFVRFLGDRKKIEEMNEDDTWDKIIWDRTEDLERWVPLFADLLTRKLDVLAYFNNHYAGYAPGSLRQFQDMLYGE